MNKQPFFSVALPIYNTAKWLGDCLESILNQDFADFEIICVNDGSTDNSAEILSVYKTQDKRIKVINKPNGGVSSARNCAINSCCGKYLYFLDSDDVMLPQALSTAYSHIVSSNYPDVLETSFDINSNGVLRKYTVVHPGDKYFAPNLTKDERAVLLWLDSTYMVNVFSKFIETSFLKNNGITFSNRYIVSEDNDFTFQLHRRAETISYADFSPCVYFAPREGSLITQPTVKSFYSQICFEYAQITDIKYYKLSTEFIEKNKRKIYDKEMEFALKYFVYAINQAKEETVKEVYLKKIHIINNFLRPYLKYIPKHSVSSFILVKLCQIIGIPTTFNLLYNYITLRGVRNHE